MKSKSLNSVFWIVALVCFSTALAQPKLVFDQSSSYDVGDQIDARVTVFDTEMKKHVLREIFDSSARVVVLTIFGGAAASVPEEAFRGELWCQDSFDDFGVQRALINQFQGQPVQFIAIAVPPIYSASRYGFDENVFLGSREDSSSFKNAFKVFVEKTEALKQKTLIPFETIYYDPRARMLQDMKGKETGPNYGEINEWQGMFKWRQDPRRYGAPTIWFLDSQGNVLTRPFWGNDYGSVPPQILYGFKELAEAVEELLEKR